MEAVRRRLGGADGGNGVGGYAVRVLDGYEMDPDVWLTRCCMS
ncbi:hypothetical protein [Streptomyces sp. 3214.6]|nr:hypothetical protein [Streptomyces sp. 3214.6]